MAPLAERIRTLRSARSLTQADLAARIGTTRRVLSSWESGRPTPGDDVPKLAQALGVTICDLYGIEEGHAAGADQDLNPAERTALDNIARELVKLRQARPRRQAAAAEEFPTNADRDTRDMLAIWNDMTPAQRQAWLVAADEVRREGTESGS